MLFRSNAAIKEAIENLTKVSHKLAETMYQAAAQQAAQAQSAEQPQADAEEAASEDGKPEEKVVDADFEVVDDESNSTS